MKKIIKFIIIGFLCLLLVAFAFRRQIYAALYQPTIDKPVVYLYPEQTEDIFVQLELEGQLMTTYPKYDDGWRCTVQPNGLISMDDNQYEYLFWEGVTDHEWELTKGFVVKREDTISFLEEKLTLLGLNTRERNDFIVYWLPKLERNNYNLLTFPTIEYEDVAKLNIDPQPDTMIRVFMVMKGLNKPINVQEQVLYTKKREGFTVVEWGGTEIE